MQIRNLSLKNFRNHLKSSFDFASTTTFVIGPNTSGKSNLLEAIYYFAIGHPFRAEKEIEAISFDRDSANLSARVSDKEESLDLEINLVKDKDILGRVLKKMKVNGVSRRLNDFVGSLLAVLFSPEDIELVTDSPSLRRRFLDNLFVQIDRDYRQALTAYEKVVRSRNRLLESIRDEGRSVTEMTFWDEKLSALGKIIADKRADFFDFAKASESWLTLSYHPSVLSESRLLEYREREIAAAQSLIGPHRDDFSFLDGDRDLSTFGSRGEQRKAVLRLKILELKFFEEKTGQTPILLLDDIFSELDSENRREVAALLKNQQTIITTTEEKVAREFDGDVVVRLPLG